MKWSKEYEDALHVVFRMLVRQMELPEKSTLTTDWVVWKKTYSVKTPRDDLRGQSIPTDFAVFVNTDALVNFYDGISVVAHELFHLKRPKVNDEYRINNWGNKWINHGHYHFIDLKEL